MTAIIDLSEPSTHKIVMAFTGMGALMTFFLLVAVIKSFTVAKNGSNLMIPFEGQSREEPAQKLYEYIPNVFKDYEVFKLSYLLQESFEQNRPAFIAFYEEKKQKYME